MSTTPYFDLTLTYEISKLFDICKLKTLYGASSQTNEAGATQEQNFAITDNERDVFDIILKDAASKVYDALSQDTKIVENAFQYDVDGKIVYKMMVHGDWDKKQSFSVHTAAENSICDYVMKEWYKLRQNVSLFQSTEVNYNTHIAEVKNLLNRRIIPAKLTYRYV